MKHYCVDGCWACEVASLLQEEEGEGERVLVHMDHCPRPMIATYRIVRLACVLTGGGAWGMMVRRSKKVKDLAACSQVAFTLRTSLVKNVKTR
jgi:hypothetical protein